MGHIIYVKLKKKQLNRKNVFRLCNNTKPVLMHAYNEGYKKTLFSH